MKAVMEMNLLIQMRRGGLTGLKATAMLLTKTKK